MKSKKAKLLILAAVFLLSGCGTGTAEQTTEQLNAGQTVINQAETNQTGADQSGGNSSGKDQLENGSKTEGNQAQDQSQDSTNEGAEETEMNYEELFAGIERIKQRKGFLDVNPIYTQRYGADPYAMVYGDTVYFYMTADTYEYDADGSIKVNGYSKINTLNVVSTKDMVNFTDHGEILVAGPNGAAKWATNSWAPAACWKNIDGKDKFFLYFADSGNGIGVLEGDSPVGPFHDPVGKGLLNREIPMCANVAWLFDPAVIVDDDGTGYIYFGGGVPEGKAAAPGTGRVAKLGADMISLDGDPVAIDVPYLFEDSGIHKYKDKYYYTYCSNFSVDQEGTDKYGFVNGEICMLVSDDPMGPYTYQERILKNPGVVFGLSGNNHHCVFNFKDQWYITYHTRVLEQEVGVEKGYRCTFISPFDMKEDGTIGLITMSKQGREAVGNLNPFETVNATTCAVMAGADTAAVVEGESGEWCVSNITSGGFVRVAGVDFEDGAKSVTMHARSEVAGSKDHGKSLTELKNADKAADTNPAVVQVRIDTLRGDVLAYLDLQDIVAAGTADFAEVSAQLLKNVEGVHDLYFIFSGEGAEILDWKFEK